MSIFKKNNKGFSFVELVIVIAIMAVMISVLAPALVNRMYTEMANGAIDTFCITNKVKHASDCKHEMLNEDSFDFTCFVEDKNGQRYQVIFTGIDGKYQAGEMMPVGDAEQEEKPSTPQTIQIPEGHKFVGWATEGKSYIIEDENGIQSIVILEFD